MKKTKKQLLPQSAKVWDNVTVGLCAFPLLLVAGAFALTRQVGTSSMNVMAKQTSKTAPADNHSDDEMVAFQIRIPAKLRKAMDSFRDEFKKKHHLRPSLNDVVTMAIERLMVGEGISDEASP